MKPTGFLFLILSLLGGAPLVAQTEQDEMVLEGLSRRIEATPDDTKSLYKRGMYHLWRTFNYKQALEDFDRVLKIEPENVGALIGRADVYTGRDSRFYDPKKAMIDTVKALELEPESSEVLRIRGDLSGHKDFENPNESRDYYERAIKLDPGNMLAHLGLAYTYAKEDTDFHDKNQALIHAKTAVEIAPNESLALETLGDLLGSDTDTRKDGLRLLNRAVRANPRNAGARLARGYLYLIWSMEDEAVKIMRALQKQDLSVIDSIRGNDDAFSKALRDAGKESLMANALEDFEVAEELCQHNDDVFRARAFALQHFPGQERRTLENFTRAAELNPKSTDNLMNRVDFLMKNPQLAISPDDLRGIDDDDDLNAVALAEAIAKRMPGTTKAIIADCSRVIEIEPDHDHALHLRGSLVASTLRKYDDAIKDLNRAIELRPLKAQYYETRADVHEAFGRDEESDRDRERAADLSEID